MSQATTIGSLIIDRSAKNLASSLAAVQKALADLASLAEQSQGLALQIEDKQHELAAIQEQVANARRTADAELKLQVLEDARKVFVELADRLGFAKITSGELELLTKDLAHAKRDFTEELAKLREDEQSKYQAAARAQISALEGKHAVETAQKDADLKAQAYEINSLKAQITYLQEQIAAERSTRLEVAKAESSKQGVVVNTGK